MVGIAELRARKGKMSQRELAEKIGTTQTSISNWENNPLSMNAENIVKLAMFFGVSSDDILGIERKEKQKA
ncbi:helix-turn-helix transcriptional regulator [Enterococcus avium]|uniref:helix-turn-helix domain-containing protein n=1 Tax=Enterococcus TaxID=1350 RepID=UPI001A96803F|nr:MULTISPECIES: helix-turn-helix transcriptional regulator [Enterococcus]MBO1141486.1 helix-turn-helix transcriptional regulator [Enterococcus avium]MDT2419471.1 helix-turn-helix transcriptional regulator [Enterococcus avium]MDT2432451.1 helix-turn-helix transcriptional regulator [Enterococcus avium]MDT2437571.1 helix-turn-helix transcriptional regulator [Enterococcus avium]MDT2467963.1 helix-turn-helix transcriptional regulator [Enterococcus avium]